MEGWTIAEIARRLQDAELTSTQLRRLRKDRRLGVQKLLARWKAHADARSQNGARLSAMLEHERLLWQQGVQHVAGVDEVGAGPLAGPVVAAAVILPAHTSLPTVDDSKKLSPAQRVTLDAVIQARAVAWAVGVATVLEIDTLNIYQAALLAMRRAVEGLAVAPAHLLVDARRVPGVTMQQTPLVQGDSRSQSIAAASIVAKVYRDRLMDGLAKDYPGYGFEKHRGYATAAHLRALANLGPCAVHRVSFAPVAQARQRHPLRDASGVRSF